MLFKNALKAAIGVELILSATLALAADPGAPPSNSTDAATTSATTRARQSDRVSLDLRDVPVRDALDALFNGKDVSYVLDNSVIQNPVTVTATIRDASFDLALNTILRAAGLRATRQQGIYTITIRQQDTTNTNTTTATDNTATTDNTTTQPSKIEKIPLFHVSPEIVQLLGGTMIPTDGSSSGGFGNSSGGGGFGSSGGSGFGSSSSGFGSSGGFGSSSGGFGSSSSGFGNSGSSFGSSSGFGNSGSSFGSSSGSFR